MSPDYQAALEFLRKLQEIHTKEIAAAPLSSRKEWLVWREADDALRAAIVACEVMIVKTNQIKKEKAQS